MTTAKSTPWKSLSPEPLLFGVVGLDVAGAEMEATVDGTDEILVWVEDIVDEAMVALPLIGPAVVLPGETGPGATEAPEETLAEAGETGIGTITAGPVIVGVTEPEVGAEVPALEGP